MNDYAEHFQAALAAELRAERARGRLTVSALVERTGLSKSAVLYYLNGQRDIPVKSFVRLAAALGVAPEVLMHRAAAQVDG
ncbi:MAG: helix-turn-helix transcriptional regulator [Bifidobacteriaceae bacterium]|nr:helix-turn-helix transcriptional regulator [Bifidobacteriaceae bacterium]